MSLKDLINSKLDYFPVKIGNREYFFRRWRVGDKKEFLLQQDTEDTIESAKLTLKLIKNLLKPESKLQVDKLPKNEIFKILIEIKKQSDGLTNELYAKCPHCQQYTMVEINLNDDVKYKDFNKKPIEIDDIQFNIKPVPFLKEVELDQKYKTAVDFNFYFLLESIDSIIANDQLYKDFSKKELEEFLNELPPKTFETLFNTLKERLGYCMIFKEDCVCENCGKTFPFGIDSVKTFLTL